MISNAPRGSNSHLGAFFCVDRHPFMRNVKKLLESQNIVN